MMLYIHVPFCRSKCRYCAFFSEPLGNGGGERIRSYLDGLLAELVHSCAESRGEPVTSVFFGGGTPSLLSALDLSSLLENIGKHFALTEDAEISIEGNPESLLRPGFMKDLAVAGFNRLSVGVQSLDEGMLRMLGRIHSAEDAVRTLDAARSAGFENVNVDLMWGLPGQTLKGWLGQIDAAAALEPSHISAYGLTLEPGTPLAEAEARGHISLPPEEILAAMYLEGAARMEELGFRHFEISNFARPGCMCRHNCGYWKGEEYLGLGPAAVSTRKGVRWANPPGLEAWLEVARGRARPEREELDQRRLEEERLMLGLRTADGAAMCGEAWELPQVKAFLHELESSGLALISAGRLRLTAKGMLLSNEVLATLMDLIFP
ncbi:MAG: radical SAM family heme chaperone HemW [Deltaproteobacteria bacterium]|nr:radical SAM family heme chaperone HemW [Deltaproteobacteria bacterium]